MGDVVQLRASEPCWACDARDGEEHQLWCPESLKRRAPQDEAAEQAFLSLCLRPDSPLVGDHLDGLLPEHFVRPAHRLVWAAMRAIRGAGHPVTPVTVCQELHRTARLAQVGGPAYIGDLMDVAAVTSLGPIMAGRVADLARVRAIQDALSSAIEAGWDRSVEAAPYADATAAAVSAAVRGVRVEYVRPIAEVQAAALAIVERRQRGERAGLLTPWAEVNDFTLGLEPGRLYIVAGRPGMGKSIMGLDITLGAASDGVPAVLFSLEMSAEQLVHRAWASVGSVPLRRIRSGFLDDTHWHRITKVKAALASWPLVLDDTPALTIETLSARARRYAADGRCGLVVVDYLQIMAGGGVTDSRQRDVSEMSRGLKALSRELAVPVVALSQLNRGVETRTDRRPLLADLRESGAIEQDADTVLMLYRPAAYAREGTPEAKDDTVEVLVRKQRDGDTGTVRLRFRGEFTRLDPWAQAPEPGRPMVAPEKDWSNRDDD